ncbi:MAG: 2-oxoacid:acceptor oxidoreductase subunit alpha [Pseudomonadota bacterium]|nr:2-oxoacid:acceptor oxidoreductase subunit alpha [Pseudomonadota bacterium]
MHGRLERTNDFVVKFANVNGSGSASANQLFAKAILRMGVPVSPRNIFPSNIQGLPTWYEVRVSEAGYLGARSGVDLMVAMNPETWSQDMASVEPGGYVLYDSTRARTHGLPTGCQALGVPLTALCSEAYSDARQRQLFKNTMYVGVLAQLLGIEFAVLETLVRDQFKRKAPLINANLDALSRGWAYAEAHLEGGIGLQIQRRDACGDRIFIDGNTAAALGAIYGGATFSAWYPITPSSSLAEAYMHYAERLRVDPDGQRKYVVVQAEDELAAIGMVVGAAWNGARAFTATSGPGISLMQEFLGLAYFAEIPAVIFDVQRGGPSTGMPTRTQQSDVLACAHAGHGDTRHPLLLPSDPRECFDFSALAFDLADRLQTPVFVLSDLDIGMNERLCDPLDWDDARTLDRGKVLDFDALDSGAAFGRYLDVDGDGIPYRTLPGTHPERGAFFTRGTTKDAYARYSEAGDDYVANMERLLRKYERALRWLPEPLLHECGASDAVIFFGSTAPAMHEALDMFADAGAALDALRVRSVPFHPKVGAFCESHRLVFVVEQNRDGQLRSLLIEQFDLDPKRLVSLCHYDGTPITARFIVNAISHQMDERKVVPLRKQVEP